VEKVRLALNTVGTPKVVEVESKGATVMWDPCRPNAFPHTPSQSSSVVERVCYMLTWAENAAATSSVTGNSRDSNSNNQVSSTATPKTQVSCGSLCKYLMESLTPDRTYEVAVYAIVNDLKGALSEPVTFTTKGLPPERPSPPVLKSAARNSLLVTWQPPNNGPKVTTYKLFVCEESRSLDLAGVDLNQVSLAPGKVNKNSKISTTTTMDERLKYEGCLRSAKVEHLAPNTEYKLRIVACNVHGSSPPSSEVILRTLPQQPPQPDPPE